MGFLGYLLPPNIIFDNDTINDPTFINKICYFFIDKLNINYITARNPEEVNIDIKLNMYGSYEERLVRDNHLMTIPFSIVNLIDKNFSENLWTKCYIKIKEQLLNKNTQYLKDSLNLGENDTIPTQYQYLLEINDHFN